MNVNFVFINFVFSKDQTMVQIQGYIYIHKDYVSFIFYVGLRMSKIKKYRYERTIENTKTNYGVPKYKSMGVELV